MGDAITEADVRLFTTLARFDAVYHGHFKCNRNKLTEMPALWGYARDLFQTPGFGETIDFDQIKAHYYVVQTEINPSRIIPKGPDDVGLADRRTGAAEPFVCSGDRGRVRGVWADADPRAGRHRSSCPARWPRWRWPGATR